jgi:hypothetical protein
VTIEQKALQAFNKLAAAGEVTPRLRHSFGFGFGFQISRLQTALDGVVRSRQAIRNMVAKLLQHQMTVRPDVW